MNKSIPLLVQKVLRIGFWCAAAATLVMQTVSVITCYESEANYFQSEAVFPVISYALLFLTLALGTLDAFLNVATGDYGRKYSFVPLFAAIGFAVPGVELLIQSATTLGIISAILLLLSSVYAVFASFDQKELKTPTIYLGFAPVLSCASLTACHYFDFTIEMNAPLKLIVQCGLLCAMLFYTGELRYLLGQPAPRLYRMLAAWTVAFAAIGAIPTVVAFLMGKTDRTDLLSAGILLLGVGAVATLRLVSIQRPSPIRTDGDDSII